MQRAVIYARFSSDMQREESIEAQVRACKEYCKRKHYCVVGIYSDEAKSGRDVSKRDGYNQMLADALQDKFDVIIFHKIDRNSRNELNYYTFKDKLERLGISYEYASQSIDSSPEGQMMESMLVGMAAYYSRNLAKEVKKGQNENAYKALTNGGIAPFGLKIVNKRYEINEAEADGVRMIFSMYLAGHGYGSIAKALAAKGYTTRTGKPFAKNSMHDILLNEKYAGTYVFNKSSNINGKRNSHPTSSPDLIRVENAIPAIISKADFLAVQEKMKKNKQAPGHYSQTVNYILAGKIFCGLCGSAMIGHRANYKLKDGTIKHRAYYICGHRQRNTVEACKLKMIDKQMLEDGVIEVIKHYILADDMREKLAKEIAAAYQEITQESTGSKSALIKAQAAAERRLNNLYTIIEDGNADDFDFARLKAVKAELLQLKQKLADVETNSRLPALGPEQILAILNNFQEKITEGDTVSRQALIDLFIHRVTVYPDMVKCELTITSLYSWLVEMRGVEPLSENIAI